jgi:pimeloyl-ACP methyl ester carboxylesterase
MAGRVFADSTWQRDRDPGGGYRLKAIGRRRSASLVLSRGDRLAQSLVTAQGALDTAHVDHLVSRSGTGPCRVGYSISGQGPVVMLLHSSVSGSRQWRALVDALDDRYTMVTVDLIGYGETPPWEAERPQRLTDQSALVHELAEQIGSPRALVGHSLGGSVALCAAAELGERLAGLILLEPNPFGLLQATRQAEFAEAWALRNAVKQAGRSGDWEVAAERFADYWNGAGSWVAMSEKRRRLFAEALRPNYHEWDAVLGAPVHDYVAAVRAQTSVTCARDTVPPIAAIVTLLQQRRPDWRYIWLEHGGHMAPLSRPELVNRIVSDALDQL